MIKCSGLNQEIHLLIIIFHRRKRYYGLWTKHLNSGFVSASDVNWWTVYYCDVFIRLSFWRHPVTAEHMMIYMIYMYTYIWYMLRLWWNAAFIQIFIFGWTVPLNSLHPYWLLYYNTSVQMNLWKSSEQISVCKDAACVKWDSGLHELFYRNTRATFGCFPYEFVVVTSVSPLNSISVIFCEIYQVNLNS